MGGQTREHPLTALGDDELLAIVQTRPDVGPGAREAMELLFERHHARVHAQCARLLGDELLADDATQEIFLSMLEKPLRYDGRQYFGSWLYIVARNHCLNQIRRRRREIALDEPEISLAEHLVDPSSPAHELADQQLGEILRGACDEHLNEREREVVHLRYFWGLRVKEINDVLGLTNVSGARSQLATAHRKLRAALAPYVSEDGLAAFFDEGST